MQEIAENFYICTPKTIVSEKEIQIKFLESIGINDNTPIDITSLTIHSIQLKYLSYVYNKIDYQYRVWGDYCKVKDVYETKVTGYEKSAWSSGGLDAGYKETTQRVKVGTTDEWYNFDNSGEYTDKKVVSLSLEDNVLVKALDNSNINFITNNIKELPEKHDSEANLEFYTDIKDVSDTVENIYIYADQRLQKQMNNKIPHSDKSRNVYTDYSIVHKEGAMINLPFYEIKFEYKGQIYTAGYSEYSNFVGYLNIPIDQDIQEIKQSINSSSKFLFFILLVLNILIFWFFRNDPYYRVSNLYIYIPSISIIIIIVEFFKNRNLKSEELNPIKDEKKYRLEKRLELID